jgi:hypothetical protein
MVTNAYEENYGRIVNRLIPGREEDWKGDFLLSL